MFDTSFTHTTEEPLDSSIPDEDIIGTLHDFDSVITTNPDCRGHQLSDKKASDFPDHNPSKDAVVYDCKDALNFIPEKLWDGGVWYKAIYTKLPDGCDIIVVAPMGLFSSNNKWRFHKSESGEKSMSIESVNKCNRTFAHFVKGFLEKSHKTQQASFREKLGQRVAAKKEQQS